VFVELHLEVCGRTVVISTEIGDHAYDLIDVVNVPEPPCDPNEGAPPPGMVVM
jgi:hypothetical protein